MRNEILVDNELLFFETLGNDCNPPILYIHGAPGIGVLDFIYFQGENFESDFYVVAPEQRGVWRSDAVKEYSIEKIINGYETIRKNLGIKKWNVLTHCFGARIFIEYYRKFPEVFEKIVFENPIITSIEPFENIIPLQLKILKNKNINEYNRLLPICNEIHTISDLECFSEQLSKAIEMDTNHLIMGEKTVKELKKLKKFYDYNNSLKSRETEIMMSRAESLYSIEEDYLIKLPLLVLYSSKDISMNTKTLENIEKRALTCEIIYFQNSKHWIHIDEAQKYYDTVINFFNKD
ncbi:alpha/beta fold hydrolase [Streptococcus sp. ZY1909104]|uniref:alpha/beta hydrolase n=1 Tax=Streptococcus sp. ZY1909104 TaxID=3233335 RepID=UPI00298F9B54|nr:alpha/beta hydrolase [Streptococcus suis]